MKKKFLLGLALFLQIKLLGQLNLVPNGDFESLDLNQFFDSNNPYQPCNWGQFLRVNPYPSYSFEGISSDNHWQVFHVTGQGADRQPDLFDSRYQCSNNTNNCGSQVDCSYDANKVGVPNNYYGNQAHRSPVTGNVIGRYVGIKSVYNFPLFGGPFTGINGDKPNYIDHEEGIKVKLLKPLKCGYVYHLKFYAVQKAGGQHKLQIRFGDGDRWVQDKVLINNTSYELNPEITENSNWQLIDIPFYVDQSNVQWLFILAPNVYFFGQKNLVLLDDIEIIDQCALDNVCDITLDATTDEITTNGFHNANQPLTFFNTESSKDIKIEIFPINNQTVPIRTISITDPGPTIAWDGKNNNGAIVANAPYRYKISYGAACSCRLKDDIFIKNGNPEIFNVTYGTYQGALTFYNLDNVHEFYLKIYNAAQQLIYVKQLFNPPNTIYWNGLDDAGNPIGAVPTQLGCGNPTLLNFDLEVRNNCGSRVYENVSFTQICNGNNATTGISNFNYIASSKPLETCLYSFDYTSHAKPPKECCDAEVDLFLQNIYISGIKEFKLIHDIQAGPKVVVKTNSDVKFLAGHEIRLVNDFTTEPGAEFLARIEPCMRMVEESGPHDIIRWTEFPNMEFDVRANDSILSTEKITVYPNPTSDDLNVKAETIINSIEVFDLTGKLISGEYSLNSNLIKINASSLLKGIYIMRITLMNGQTEAKKIIKN